MAKIVFLIDSSKLPRGGATVNAAVAVGHPPFYLNGVLKDAEFKVPVKKGEDILIYTEEQYYATNVKIAPNGIIAHTFNGKQLTVSDMNDPATRPIDVPNFDMDPDPASPDFIAYVNGTSEWDPAPSSWSNWANNPLIDRELKPSVTASYTSFVKFTASTIVSGELQYGMVFGLTRDGKSVEYFYFDPFLEIGS